MATSLIRVTMTSPNRPEIIQVLEKPEKGPAKVKVPSGYKISLAIQAPDPLAADEAKTSAPKLSFKKMGKNLVVFGDADPLVEVERYFATPDVGVNSVSWDLASSSQGLGGATSKTQVTVEGIAGMPINEVAAVGISGTGPMEAGSGVSGLLTPVNIGPAVAGTGLLGALFKGGGAAASAAPVVLGSAFKITVALGPTTDGGAGTSVKFYKADGQVLAGTGKFSTDGTYSFQANENYSGKLFVQVTDNDSATDYIDEKTGLATNVGTSLWVATNVTNSQVTSLTVSPLSTLALGKALGVLSVSELLAKVTGAQTEDVDPVVYNKAIANFFKLGEVDLATESVIFAINTKGEQVADVNAYGKALLLLSNYNTSALTTVNDLLSALSVEDSGCTLLEGAIATRLKQVSASPYVANQHAPENMKTGVDASPVRADTQAPKFAKDELSVSVVENTAGVVTTIQARDDFGVKKYSFAGGPDDDKFNIHATTGAVSFKTAPNFDKPLNADNKYVIKVKAEDASGNSSQQTVTINVTNVDDTAPVFDEGQTQTVRFMEGKTGTVVVVKTHDPETDPDKTTPTKLSLAGGADDTKFNFDAATGELSFKAVPDYETPLNSTNTYTVQIKAEDASGNSSVQTITVKVVNVDETHSETEKPRFEAGITASVDFPVNSTNVVWTAIASDNYGVSEYEISGGADASLFKINASTGALTFKEAPSLQTSTTYTVAIKVKDAEGNFEIQTLTVNVVVDKTAPVIQSAEAGLLGGSVILTYDETLSSSVAAKGAFSVMVDGRVYLPTNVTVAGRTITLTLPVTLTYGQEVSVSYSDPDASKNDEFAVQDSDGNDANSLQNYAVNTLRIADVSSPQWVSAQTSNDGQKIILTYNEALSSLVSAVSQFSVKVDDSAVNITAAIVVGQTVELTLATAVASGQAIKVSYTDPSTDNDTDAIQDRKGNDAASFTDKSVTNLVTDTTPPAVPTAAAGSDGRHVILTFNESLSASVPSKDQFAVKVNGQTANIRSLSVNSNKVLLELENRITKGMTVTVSYTDPSSANDANAIQDNSGNDVATFSSMAVDVTNAPDADLRSPVLQSAETSSGGSKIILAYDEVLNLTTAGPSSFSVKVNDQSVVVNSVLVIGKTVELSLAQSVRIGQSVKLSYVDPSSSNDANAIQDEFGNDAVSLTDQTVANRVAPTTFTLSTITPGIKNNQWEGGATDKLEISQTNSFTKLAWDGTASKLNIRTGAAAATGVTQFNGSWDTDGSWFQGTLTDVGTVTLSNYLYAWASFAGLGHSMTLNLQSRQQAWVVGSDSDDTFNVGTDTLGSGNDTVEAGKGNDTINLLGNAVTNGNGRTTLKWTLLSSTDGRGGNDQDVVNGFTTNRNSLLDSGDDVLDLSALVADQSITYSTISSYLSVSNNGSDTVLKLDRDGAGAGSAVDLLTLNNLSLSNTDLPMLYVSGQIKLGNAQTLDSITTGTTGVIWTGNHKDTLNLSQQNAYIKLDWDQDKLSVHTGSAPATGSSTLNASWNSNGDWFQGSMSDVGIVNLFRYKQAWVDFSGMAHEMVINLNQAEESWVKGTDYGDIIHVGTTSLGSGSDTIEGGKGDDQITINNPGYTSGKTTIRLGLYDANDGGGGNGQDVISGFSTDNDNNFESGEDIIDLSALFVGLNITSTNLSQYLRIDPNSGSGSSTLQIDRDGSGAAHAWASVLTLNALSLSADDLVKLFTARQIIV